MVLQDLNLGQEVILQIKWGDASHDLKTEVVGSNESGLLIKPFIYNGVVINLPENKVKDIIFNIYANDPVTSARMAWKNASVKPVSYKGRTYYACTVNDFQKFALSSDRRADIRMPLNIRGTMSAKDFENIPVVIYDISDSGVAFLLDKNMTLPLGVINLKFVDTVRGNTFTINIKCRPVRERANGQDSLYGCRMLEVSNEVLIYICMKRMDMNSRL